MSKKAKLNKKQRKKLLADLEFELFERRLCETIAGIHRSFKYDLSWIKRRASVDESNLPAPSHSS
jgi:septum formation inhibitor-activating ATPase MinD